MGPLTQEPGVLNTVTVTVTFTDNLLQHELQKSLHPSPVVSRLLRRPVQSSPTWSVPKPSPPLHVTADGSGLSGGEVVGFPELYGSHIWDPAWLHSVWSREAIW
jgi:hypothetical protein